MLLFINYSSPSDYLKPYETKRNPISSFALDFAEDVYSKALI